jgi:uncharacterized membrane protein YbhN (UPF0104 family)
MRLRRNAAGHVVATTVAFVVFLASLWIIARELRGFAYAEVWAYLKGLPPTYVVLAFGLTTLTFVVLSGYDALALRYVGVDLPRKRILFSAFVGYAVSQALGNPILTGGAVRYRLYSLWGLPPAAVAKSILFAGLSFWLGFFALGGGVLLVNPDLLTDISPLPVSAPVLGALALAPVVMYAGGTWYRATPVTIWGWTLKVPPQWMLPVQVALAAGDLVLASSVVYVLLPPGTGVGLVQLLAAYLVALLAGLVSHVPGGLGVFESVMLLLLTPDVSAPILLGGLLAYRGIFHLLPLTLAALAFGAYEFWYGTSARTADPEAN